MDLSQFPSAEIGGFLAAAVESAEALGGNVVAIVQSTPEEPIGMEARFVEVTADMKPVERASLTYQMLNVSDSLFLSTAVMLDSTGMEAMIKQAATTAFTEIVVNTRTKIGEESCDIGSSRTVACWVNRRLYEDLRGLDSRIYTIRDAFTDFARRAKSWGALMSRIDLRQHWVAFEPPHIEQAPAQVFDLHKARGLMVNLPRWRHRPFTERPTVSVLRVGSPADAKGIDATRAQVLDGCQVIELPDLAPDDFSAIDDALDYADAALVSVIPTNVNIPPWRFVEQVQHIRSPDTYCVGAAAVNTKSGLMIIDSTAEAQGQVCAPGPLSTILAPKTVMRSLLRGELRHLRRARTTRIVACGPGWVNASLRPSTCGERARVSPYLADAKGTLALHFTQFTVGRIDYIDAYHRIGAIATLFSPSGQPIREMAAVDHPVQTDIECLAGLGLPFELMAFDESEHDIGSFLLTDLITREFGSMTHLNPIEPDSWFDVFADPGTRRIYLRVPGLGEGWFAATPGEPGAHCGASSDEILRKGVTLCSLS